MITQKEEASAQERGQWKWVLFREPERLISVFIYVGQLST